MQNIKIDLTAIILTAATMTIKVKELQGENDNEVVMGYREEIRFPKLLSFTKEQFEVIAYEILKTPAFSRSFIDAAKAIANADNNIQVKMLGNMVDFHTRAIAQSLANQLNRPVQEEAVKQFRYAVMNIIRDEAARYAKGTKGDHFEILTEVVRTKNEKGQSTTKLAPVMENGKVKQKWTLGKHTDYHVAKGHKDENQVLVDDALGFLDSVLATRTEVARYQYDDGRNTILAQKEDSVYANEDATQLLFDQQEQELEYILGQAGFKWYRGETPSETLNAIRSAVDTLMSEKEWMHIKDSEFHIDRLVLADQLQNRIQQVTSAKAVAHKYIVNGHDIKVGIANGNIEKNIRNYVYVVKIVDENSFAIFKSDFYSSNESYKFVKEEILSDILSSPAYQCFLETHEFSDNAQLEITLR